MVAKEKWHKPYRLKLHIVCLINCIGNMYSIMRGRKGTTFFPSWNIKDEIFRIKRRGKTKWFTVRPFVTFKFTLYLLVICIKKSIPVSIKIRLIMNFYLTLSENTFGNICYAITNDVKSFVIFRLISFAFTGWLLCAYDIWFLCLSLIIILIA